MEIKNRYILRVLMVAVAMMSVTSCVTPRRVNYLQDMAPGRQIELEHRYEAHITPYDEMIITVATTSQRQELAAPFNSMREDGGYLVDQDGNIDFPVLGRMRVGGMTRLQLQDSLVARLARGGYLEDAFVQVRFKNFKIFVLGNGGGRVINVPNEQCNFLEALAMMGGLDNYTRRDRIGVMREVNGKMVVRYLDPRSSQVFSDPFFMLHQNDFIILDGVSGNTLRQELTYWVGFSSALISAATLVTTLLLLRKE